MKTYVKALAAASAMMAAGSADAALNLTTTPVQIWNGGTDSPSFQQFDPMLGELKSVNIEYAYNTVGSVFIQNTSRRSVNYTRTVTITNSFAGMAGAGSSQAFISSCTGGLQIAAGQSGSIQCTTADTTYRTITASDALATFIGAGQNTFAATSTYAVNGTGTGGGKTNATLKLSYSYIATSAVAAVPEPATWAMMAGGFAMVGAAARRRRRTFVAA